MNPKLRQQWVAMLAKLTAPMDATTAAKSLGDMLPMLADLPDDAFSMTSLEHVASQCRRVPTYAELRSQLGGWWRDNRPNPPAIASPPPTDWRDRYNIPKPRDPPTEAEMEYVAELMRKLKMETGYRQSAELAAAPKPPKAPAVMTDRQLLAMHEATGNTIRAAALRTKITAAEKILPFRPAP